MINQAINHLKTHDPILGSVIERHEPCDITEHDRYYEELASSIVSQQLSVKAARTIWHRFLDLFDGKMPSPDQIIATDDQIIRSAGLSGQKVRYIKDLAAHIVNGELEIDKLNTLSNDEIIQELTAVKGIGIWSAHMFMIFSLARLDVLAWGDLGVRKSAQTLYNLPTLPTKEDLETLAEQNHWAPYESVVCWYLWKALDNK